MDIPVSYDLLDPLEAGLDPDAFETFLERAGREVASGLLPSAQFALARHGRLVARGAFGRADDRTRYIIFSATKGVVGAAVAILIGEGKLDVSQKVADLIPEFATNGKDVITVEQVLTHTAGFPHAPLGHHDREDRLAAMSRARLNWEPGTRYEYHPTSAHWVLAEIIERLSGEDYRTFIHDRIVDHLGLRSLRLGVAPEDQGDVADLELCGDIATPEELKLALGIEEIPRNEVTDDALMSFNDPATRAVGIPGGGAVSTASDLVLFYQALLHNPGGMWNPGVLQEFTANPRNHLPDPLFGVPANRALNFLIAGDDGKANYRGFGHTNSPRAFGHNGAAGQIAWADPATGLSFSWLTNGIDQHVLRQPRRAIGISSKTALVVKS